MKHLIIVGGLVLSAALLMAGISRLPVPFVAATPTAAQGVTPDVRGVLEWEIRDATAPYPNLVVPLDAGVWFGYAGANLYGSWTEGDRAGTLYLPPPECQISPQKQCGSIFPHGGCFTAVVTYRWPDFDPVRTAW